MLTVAPRSICRAGALRGVQIAVSFGVPCAVAVPGLANRGSHLRWVTTTISPACEHGSTACGADVGLTQIKQAQRSRRTFQGSGRSAADPLARHPHRPGKGRAGLTTGPLHVMPSFIKICQPRQCSSTPLRCLQAGVERGRRLTRIGVSLTQINETAANNAYRVHTHSGLCRFALDRRRALIKNQGKESRDQGGEPQKLLSPDRGRAGLTTGPLHVRPSRAEIRMRGEGSRPFGYPATAEF